MGEWAFLGPSISRLSCYRQLLSRAHNGETVLEVGACFGKDLRLFASNGIAPSQLFATDVNRELWDLGFELFRDKHKLKDQFVPGDFLDPLIVVDLQRLQGHAGGIDMFILCQFLHPFSWDRQVQAGLNIVRLSKPGSIVVGYQRGLDHQVEP